MSCAPISADFCDELRRIQPAGVRGAGVSLSAESRDAAKAGALCAAGPTAYRKTRDTVRIFCDGKDVSAAAADLVRRDVGPQGMPAPAGGRRALLYTTATMADLADLLENHGFVRTHKSVLVNMEHIRNLQSTRLYLRDGTELPVSSHTASAVRKIYTQWRSAKNGLLVGITFSCLDVLCVAVFAMCFLKEKQDYAL